MPAPGIAGTTTDAPLAASTAPETFAGLTTAPPFPSQDEKQYVSLATIPPSGCVWYVAVAVFDRRYTSMAPTLCTGSCS